MKKIQLLFITLLILILSHSSLSAADFVSKDVDGTMNFKCAYCCHQVRVLKLGNGKYRVYSISFAGILTADSPLQAARKACKEDKPSSEQNQ